MSSRLIVVVVDGMRDDMAKDNLGYIEHLVDVGVATRLSVQSELPSISRPLYEVLLTGTPSSENGITSNHSIQLSSQESLFHLTTQQGLVNATASYYWVSELYNRSPFDFVYDREQKSTGKAIQHGKFYWDDAYPDSHLMMDGEVLRQQVEPDFLYIHPMNVDDTGHKFGGISKEYQAKVLQMDNYLSGLIPIWQEAGYQIVITADHGMSELGLHGGTTASERMVPLYIISNKVKKGRFDFVFPQLAFAPFMCKLMDITKSEKMQALPDLIISLMESD
ncbi:alkaline phosphatase family protein [Salinicoccus sesuvii]|uniref:Alkaline phosphatase family protein n=1 Tax=Salinicoccus sesuvii TaxID=868281 RepID=A0ABV7N713_9STAP